MGTRNLTLVQLDGKYHVAQYGQWDGYPSSQGATILDFLATVDLEQFKAKLRLCRFATDLERKGMRSSEAEFAKHPHLSRDNAAEILSLIMESDGLILEDESAFAADSLMCEYAYCLDLDKGTLEVFKGFNESPLPDGERFSAMPPHIPKHREGQPVEYWPVKLAATYPLDKLPTVDQMADDVDPEEVEA